MKAIKCISVLLVVIMFILMVDMIWVTSETIDYVDKEDFVIMWNDTPEDEKPDTHFGLLQLSIADYVVLEKSTSKIFKIEKIYYTIEEH